MNRNGTAFNLSFLDLICSAMGGVIILALIFSMIKNPVILPNRGEFILFEVRYRTHGPDVGMIIMDPSGSTTAVVCGLKDRKFSQSMNADTRVDAWHGSVASAAADTTAPPARPDATTASEEAVLYVEVKDPGPGAWRFYPYLVDWAARESAPVTILEVSGWTRGGPLPRLPAPTVAQQIVAPGVAGGTTYEVRLQRGL